MPVDDLYWNAIDFGSDESIHDPNSKHYVDPWDLENYAYIREHLDSIDLSSNPSGSTSGDGEFIGGGSSSSNGEFVEANSTSFYYVPAQNKNNHKTYNRGKITNNAQLMPPSIPEMMIDDGIKQYDSLMTDQSNYVAIDELKIYERNRLRKELMDSYGPQRVTRRHHDYATEIEENPYDDGFPYHMSERHYGKVIPPFGTTTRDRSLSFSYGDQSYFPEDQRYDIYSKLDEYPMMRKDATLPIYDDERRSRRKPTNFGLSNYGHLKIDYSYSWNNLNKYISN